MIGNYIEEIKKNLDLIQKENKENIDNLIHYETSAMYGVGSLLYMYGKLYKIVFNSESFDQVIQELEKLQNYTLNSGYDFGSISEEIQTIQNLFIKSLKSVKNSQATQSVFEDIKLDIEFKIEHEYIFKTMLESI